ncbi:MAG: FecR domain-containing protein, partial [Desulfobulbaceae bacterium]|nr:FecR domain-containing protein [Desulfobulbaceae bacterium]
MKKYILFLLVLFSAIWIGSAVDAAITVGRISTVEGQIYRYMDVDDSWVATSQQSPAGTQDVLLTGGDSKAEIAFPNDQLVRLDENTEIEILELDDDIVEFILHSGLARFYNRSSAGKLLIETARGTATVESGSAIDVLADKKSVTVSAVYGEAIFRSYQDGAETVEVISGSTSLEFQEKSIIAGIGPIDRKWDRWCADREGVLAQNRMVRSEYLPESMQEYAYAMEPNGRWQRIYYSGYYYWAWKPHSVDVGWSPYTTGYWDDWHGSPVWIDNNPWGWATHHHGQWLNMYGAWLWTPYVHISNVPGVTAIGFNISFGRTYRSQWHPGRVRWIAYNDNIGWMPLAPREAYYGYRKWGPRTVVMERGASLSININLSNHRYINHAVIVPKNQLYQRKHGVINNYNTVRIKNVNKTTIVKNYKPLLTSERERDQKHTVKAGRVRNAVRRAAIVQPERKKINTGEAVRLERGDDRTMQTRRDVQKKTKVQATRKKRSRQNIGANVSSPGTEVTTKDRDQARTRESRQVKVETRSRNKVVDQKTSAIRKRETGKREIQEKVVSSGQRVRERNVEKQEKPLQGSSTAASVSAPGKEVTTKGRNQSRTRESRQVKVETRSRNRVVAEKTAATIKRDTVARQKIPQEKPQHQRQAALNEERAKKTGQKNNRKYSVNDKQEEKKTEQKISRNKNSSREKNVFLERNTGRQGPGREWV